MLACSLTGCFKKEQHKLTGRIVTDCKGTSYANQKIALKGEGQLIGKSLFLETTTDAQGRFTFLYDDAHNSTFVRINQSGPIIERIPAGKSLDLGDIFTEGNANFVVKLQANKAYTDKDTLHYFDYNLSSNSNRFLIGPFKSSVLDSVRNWPLLGPAVYGDNNMETLRIGFAVGSKKEFSYKNFSVDRCGKWGEVTIVID
jgi:hypothetical protein